MIEENLKNIEDVVCCIKCKKGFKKIRSFYSKEGVKNRIVEFVKNYEKGHYSLIA